MRTITIVASSRTGDNIGVNLLSDGSWTTWTGSRIPGIPAARDPDRRARRVAVGRHVLTVCRKYPYQDFVRIVQYAWELERRLPVMAEIDLEIGCALLLRSGS